MPHPLRLAAFTLLAGLAALATSPLSAGEKKTDHGFVELFNGKDLTGWKVFPESAQGAFKVEDGAVSVSGKPAGYFYTDKSYRNYVLRYDWKFLKDGNSGLLVHIQKHNVWPKSLEIQGMQKQHGSIIGIGIKVKAKVDAKAQKEAIKIGDWNTTEVTVKNGVAVTTINGKEISTAEILSEDVKEGPLGFQSEGSPLLFKNIKIKVLDGSGGGGGGNATKLFNGKDLSGWKTYFDPKSKDDPAKSIVVKGGEIQVSGQPFGYFYTDKSYKNYVLSYTWTYPKEQPEKTTMNSGCLVHIQEPHKIWPHSVEPQVRYKDHGKLFFIDFPKGVKNPQNFDEAAQQKALKASHEWNTTEVTAKADGTIEVRINGTLVNTGKSNLTEGPIGFQSEGARIHFKDITLRELK